jgi:hypothetical protein
MSVITDLFAGVPVSDLDVSVDWYMRFSGWPSAHRAGDEILWEILGVAGLRALLERLAAEHIERQPLETYSNDVRHVKVPDPDGNAPALMGYRFSPDFTALARLDDIVAEAYPPSANPEEVSPS